MGEYLEDYGDPRSWDIAGLCKWAMSAFRVSLSPAKIKHQEPEEIEEQLISAAAEQIDKKDCSQLMEFLEADFGARTFIEWARAKFDIKLDLERLKSANSSQIRQQLGEETAAKYKQREIEYPVEFAMNMVYGPEGLNVYAFEALADWANKRDAGKHRGPCYGYYFQGSPGSGRQGAKCLECKPNGARRGWSVRDG